MKVDMTQRYRRFKRAWGTYYAYDNATGNSITLKTQDKAEATRKVNAMNETERQPSISLGLARGYRNATDPKLATRTWQEVMEHIVEKKTDETRRRWDVAIKDNNFDRIRNLKVAENRNPHPFLTSTIPPRDNHPDESPKCGTTICLPVIAPLAKNFARFARRSSFNAPGPHAGPDPAPKDLSSGLLFFC